MRTRTQCGQLVGFAKRLVIDGKTIGLITHKAEQLAVLARVEQGRFCLFATGGAPHIIGVVAAA